ncbi:MAG: peptide ABC transporter substrate-binding protein [Patescibacteria group bacterium]
MPIIQNIKKRLKSEETPDVNQQLLFKLNQRKLPSWTQVTQLPKVLNTLEKLQFSLALLILIASLSWLGVRWYTNHSTSQAATGGNYTEGLVGAPDLINPILATTDVDRDLVKLTYAGLMKFDEQGQIMPDLASSYTIDASQKVYTFELKNNLEWQDGENLTAADVIFTINNIKNPEYKSPYRASFANVTVNQINDNTVQFTLDKPMPTFLSLLTIGLLPEHLWYSIPAIGATLTDLNLKPIGAGPYKFKSLTRDASGNIKSYTLVAWNKYHAGPAYISNLIFKFYPDFETAVTALQNKNVEGLIYLPKEYKNQIKNNNLTLHELRFPQYTAIFFNPDNNSLLAQSDFRRALALAVDKQRILNEVLHGDGQIIDTPVLPGMLGYDSSIKAESYSPEKAKQLLDKLGWQVNTETAFRTKTGAKVKEGEKPEELSIKLTTIDQSDNSRIVSIIRENWQAVGIKTELEIIPRDRIKKEIIEPRNYQALVFGEVLNQASGPYPFWHSSQTKNPGLNLSNFSNPSIDKDLELIRQATSDEAKISPLQDFQKKLSEQNFAIFLYNPTYTYPTASKLKGLDSLQFINLSTDRFNNISSWYIKTKRALNKKTN